MLAIETRNQASPISTANRALNAAKPRPRFRPEGYGYHDAYEPTQEDISVACRKIRAEWSDEERVSRKAFNPDEPQPWTAPLWRDPALAQL